MSNVEVSKIKVYHLFIAVALTIAIHGLIAYSWQDDYVINVHDTYFVALKLDYVLIFSVAYFLDGIGYWLFLKKLQKRLVTSMTWLHSIIWTGGYFGFWLNELLRDDVTFASGYEMRFILIFGLGLLGHILFLANLAIATFRRRN